MEWQNFFVYSDENDEIKMFVLALYSYILKITSRRVIYEFIMENKHEVPGFKVKLLYEGLGGEVPAAGGNGRSGGFASSFFGDFCIF